MLRFLATGMLYYKYYYYYIKNIHIMTVLFFYRVPSQTIRKIVPEMCLAIVEELQQEFMKMWSIIESTTLQMTEQIIIMKKASYSACQAEVNCLHLIAVNLRTGMESRRDPLHWEIVNTIQLRRSIEQICCICSLTHR